MAITPEEAELAQYNEVMATLRQWERAIDEMLKKGGRVFHFVNPDFLSYFPILCMRYFKHGWILRDGGLADDGQTHRILFAVRQDVTPPAAETPKNEQPTA